MVVCPRFYLGSPQAGLTWSRLDRDSQLGTLLGVAGIPGSLASAVQGRAGLLIRNVTDEHMAGWIEQVMFQSSELRDHEK